MRKAIAYLRVSTQAQAGEDRYGLEAQKQAIDVFCADNDIEVMEYAQDNISGVKDNRPALDGLIYSNDNAEVDCIVISKSDRLARDINLYFWYKMELAKRGMELIAVDNDFGSFGAFAPVIETFTMFAAQQERNNIAKRCAGGRNVKAKLGGYSGGTPPLGYYAINGMLAIHPKEAEVVRKIFADLDAGVAMHTIARTLNAEGVVSKKGGQYHTSTIAGIVKRREFYNGGYQYGENEMVEGQHEGILNDK